MNWVRFSTAAPPTPAVNRRSISPESGMDRYLPGDFWIVLAVAEEGIDPCRHRLEVLQSAVSQAIRRLKDQIGVRIPNWKCSQFKWRRCSKRCEGFIWRFLAVGSGTCQSLLWTAALRPTRKPTPPHAGSDNSRHTPTTGGSNRNPENLPIYWILRTSWR